MNMKIRLFLYCFMALSTLSCLTANAQEKIADGLEIDKTVHNFGDIMLGSGPVSCDFNIKNIGDKPAVIYNVTTTCGCTDVEWTREPIRPGKTGRIYVTYSNDEGPYPFDKNLTVYLSDVRKPVILKLRGVSQEKPRPLEELYPVHFGPLAMKEAINRCGNLEQGNSRSETILVANISDKPIKVGFADMSDNLQIRLLQNPIPAKSTTEMVFTVNTAKGIWGKNTYTAVPVINGNRFSDKNGNKKIGVWAFTKDNFNHLTEEQQSRGSMPRFESSTFNFGKVPAGTVIHATFRFKNEGKECFIVHKVDADACCYSHSDIPAAKPGEEVAFRVHLDTKDMPEGESMTVVTLTTNSPLRPIVNLFISGVLE